MFSGRAISKFCKNEDGATLVYISLMIALLIGAVGLSVDFSRLYIADSEAQAAADAAAIAAASQLDGQSDAITRANAAAFSTPLVSNTQRFAENSGGQTGQVVSILAPKYLSDLPASDDSPLTAYTSDPFKAEFVEIETQILTHNNVFLNALGIASTKTISATAVAGQNEAICRVTPLAICNPNEAISVGANFDINEWRGRQIIVRQQGPGASWAPGNFGFLNVPDLGNGASALADTLASVDGADTCFSTRLDTQPGAINAVRSALNTRFDIYDNPFYKNAANSSSFPPSPNVTKGRVWTGNGGNLCNSVDVPGAPVTSGFPRDAAFGAPNNRIGNGIWDCLSYWTINHPNDATPAGCNSATNANTGLSRYEVYRLEIDTGIIPSPAATWDCEAYWNTNHPGVSRPAGCNTNTNTANTSRYDIYEYEIDEGLTPGPVTDTVAEEGAPVCYSGGASAITTDPALDRRMINFAVMNCVQHNVQGNSTEVPAEAFIRAFMTEPVDDPLTPGGSDFDVYLEIVDVLAVGANNGPLKETVEIYR